jgi:hypothetical protein
MGNAIKMCKGVVLLLLVPFFVSGQLKEFEVSEIQRPDVAVVQANTQFPDDALLLVYSSLEGLQFRSSMGAADKQTYNNRAGRYEVLLKPLKQMVFVSKPGYMELKISTINPNPKDVFYYKVEEKQQAVVNTKPGTLKIVTEPSGADVYMNGMHMADKTPFTGELNPGGTRIKLQKAKHETIDTTVAVRSGEPTVLNVQMKPTTLWVNISSTPSGASVTLDGTPHGTTPASFEMDLTDINKRGSKPLQLTLTDHESIITTVDLRPSSTPSEFKYSLQKQMGSFSISSLEGAQVFIGGQYKGTTPLQGTMEVGQYDVEVKLEGYMAPKQTMQIKAGSATTQLDFAMSDRSALPIAIGQEYGGGIVFELTKDGHGLVVTMEDLGKFNWEEAQRQCKVYKGGGFMDWYLPSKEELNLMYKNIGQGSALGLGNIGGFASNVYWSSTERGSFNAWTQNFANRIQAATNLSYTSYVRAVRAF